eukprot:365165-Chlamydomonas_euryale.AAC.4
MAPQTCVAHLLVRLAVQLVDAPQLAVRLTVQLVDALPLPVRLAVQLVNTPQHAVRLAAQLVDAPQLAWVLWWTLTHRGRMGEQSRTGADARIRVDARMGAGAETGANSTPGADVRTFVPVASRAPCEHTPSRASCSTARAGLVPVHASMCCSGAHTTGAVPTCPRAGHELDAPPQATM